MNTNTLLIERLSFTGNFLSLFGSRSKSRPVAVPSRVEPPTVPAVAPDAQRILVVDDDPVVVKATALKLKAKGYAVSTAPDAVSAIHAVRTKRPDLILLDLDLPQDVSIAWDGFSVLAWLKRLETTRNIPIIVVTGSEASKCEHRSLAVGAVGYFQKPLNYSALVGLISLRLDKNSRPPSFSATLGFEI